MSTMARKTLNLNEHDNTMLDASNLDNTATQKTNDAENESTTWIFEDGSALRLDSSNNVEVIANHGFHADNIQLN